MNDRELARALAARLGADSLARLRACDVGSGCAGRCASA